MPEGEELSANLRRAYGVTSVPARKLPSRKTPPCVRRHECLPPRPILPRERRSGESMRSLPLKSMALAAVRSGRTPASPELGIYLASIRS